MPGTLPPALSQPLVLVTVKIPEILSDASLRVKSSALSNRSGAIDFPQERWTPIAIGAHPGLRQSAQGQDSPEITGRRHTSLPYSVKRPASNGQKVPYDAENYT